MRAAVILALAALPPARASAATCHTYTPAEQADATLMCASAVDYEFAVPAGFHPDEAARALVGGDDAAESARLHASLDAPCKAALKKLACSCRRPFFSSPAADAPTLELDAVVSMASVRWPRRRLHDHQRVDASRERAAAVSRWPCTKLTNAAQASRPTPRAAPRHNPARRPATPSLLYAPRTCWRTSA